MEVVYERCCGLDVHKKMVVACRILPGEVGVPRKEIRTFGTMTRDLLALADWLREAGVTHVAMESTGVYWKPIYNLLEDAFALLVVNAQHIKAVPGRKTDVKDAEWIADLLRHGLLRGSFIPDAPQRELRELTRHRTSRVEDKTRVVNRLQKALEGANLKLSSVVTDINGVSARAMLEALLKGETDPTVLAELAKGRLKEKRKELEAALNGVVRPHHRLLITQRLEQIDFLEDAIRQVSAEIEERLRPFEEEVRRLDTIPGVNRRVAEVILAEVGADLTRFPTASRLASWAGICPGQCESAGKRQSGRTTQGSPWLKTALVEAAQGAARSKNTYLSAQYHRLAARRGRKKAILAVGHSILKIAYHLIQDQTEYHDLGGNDFDQRDKNTLEKRLVRRLESLGFQVSLEAHPKVA
jgi:transposase